MLAPPILQGSNSVYQGAALQGGGGSERPGPLTAHALHDGGLIWEDRQRARDLREGESVCRGEETRALVGAVGDAEDMLGAFLALLIFLSHSHR